MGRLRPGGTVDRIDLGRGRVVRTIRLGSDPTALAAGAGAGNLQFHMVWSTLLDQLWVR